jgi:hypothetical protein
MGATTYHGQLEHYMFMHRRKKIPVVPVPDRPYYFFNAIDRATLFSPGGCGLLPKWRLLSH